MMVQGRERNKQWGSSVRKPCWTTLPNESWHLPYSKEETREGETGSSGQGRIFMNTVLYKYRGAFKFP